MAICSRASLTTGSWTVGGCTEWDPDLARVRSCSRRNRSHDGGGGDRWAGRRSASSRASVGGSCALLMTEIRAGSSIGKRFSKMSSNDASPTQMVLACEAELRCREFRR